MNTKKIALLFYGEMRTYKKTFKFLKKNLLDINNIDIFISTHKENMMSSHNIDIDINVKTDSFFNCYGNNLKKIDYLEDNDLSEIFLILKQKLKVVDIDLYKKYETEIIKINNFEDWNIFYKKIYNNNKRGFYLKNKEGYTYLLHEIIMIYHRLNAFRLMERYSKENNINYDGVIIYRPDMYFLLPLDLSKFILNDQTIYFRLEFFIISSFNGIKKMITNLLDNYYCNKNNSYSKNDLYLSETQHNLIFWDKDYYLNSFGILDMLVHYQSNQDNDYCLYTPYQKGEIINLENKIPNLTEEFYKILDKCNKNIILLD